MSEAYVWAHYYDIKKYASIVEHRADDEDCTLESLLQDNAEVLEQCRKYGVEYTLIDGTYHGTYHGTYQADIGGGTE